MAPGHTELSITSALPFFQTPYGAYVHRPRSGTLFYRDGEYHHTAISFWCGGTGFMGGNKKAKPDGRFFEELPANAVLCATCEGRAIGAGQTGSHQICGRVVRFSPR